MVVYTVDKKVGAELVRLAVCSSLAEACSIVDQDKDTQQEGCVYVIDRGVNDDKSENTDTKPFE